MSKTKLVSILSLLFTFSVHAGEGTDSGSDAGAGGDIIVGPDLMVEASYLKKGKGKCTNCQELDPRLKHKIRMIGSMLVRLGADNMGYKNRPPRLRESKFVVENIFNPLTEYRFQDELPARCQTIDTDEYQSVSTEVKIHRMACTEGWITFINRNLFERSPELLRIQTIFHERVHSLGKLPHEHIADFVVGIGELYKINEDFYDDKKVKLTSETQEIIQLLPIRLVQLQLNTENKDFGIFMTERGIPNVNGGGFVNIDSLVDDEAYIGFFSNVMVRGVFERNSQLEATEIYPREKERDRVHFKPSSSIYSVQFTGSVELGEYTRVSRVAGRGTVTFGSNNEIDTLHFEGHLSTDTDVNLKRVQGSGTVEIEHEVAITNSTINGKDLRIGNNTKISGSTVNGALKIEPKVNILKSSVEGKSDSKIAENVTINNSSIYPWYNGKFILETGTQFINSKIGSLRTQTIAHFGKNNIVLDSIIDDAHLVTQEQVTIKNKSEIRGFGRIASNSTIDNSQIVGEIHGRFDLASGTRVIDSALKYNTGLLLLHENVQVAESKVNFYARSVVRLTARANARINLSEFTLYNHDVTLGHATVVESSKLEFRNRASALHEGATVSYVKLEGSIDAEIDNFIANVDLNGHLDMAPGAAFAHFFNQKIKIRTLGSVLLVGGEIIGDGILCPNTGDAISGLSVVDLHGFEKPIFDVNELRSHCN